MGLSLMDRFALLPKHERKAWLDSQPDYLVDEILRGEWWWVARPEQVPPDGNWFVCLALAGRGWGKSRSGSEWITDRVIKHPFDRHGVPTEWLVIAETLSDARVICMEGPAGILNVLERRKIKHRYKMSPRPMVLFPDGAKIYTEGADDPDVGRGYNASGAWLDEVCIAEGEPIQTARGLVPVQKVRLGDLVLTRGGFRPVSRAGLTRRSTAVLEIRTTIGTVRVTPEHRVWANGKWLMAQDLKPNDIMEACYLSQYQATPQPSMTGMVSAGTSTKKQDTTTIEQGHYSTGAIGSAFTDQFQKVTRLITLIENAGIIDSKTWKCLPSPITEVSQAGNVMMFGSKTKLQNPHPNIYVSTGNVGSLAQLPVKNVAVSTNQLGCVQSSAIPTVVPQQVGGRIKTRVISVVKVLHPVNVYDITVDDEEHPEFFAGTGSLLVHNCKWKYPKDSWDQGIMPSLRADLVGDHPRAFVTTTPKPINILTEWIKRNDSTVHVIRGSTFDNARNLSPLVLEELRRRYEGTAIGQQELYGEIIEAFEGALFSRLDMENFRVYDVPDNLVATVVGVDPSLTGEDDEMGIVVCARDNLKHMYILADRSIMAVGRAAALEAWRVVADYGADKLVLEENLGKRWMQQVFNDAYYELVGQGVFPQQTKPPLVRVDSKLGKRTRGEPVAMRSEQGRLHLVGKWEQLEDQMATFVSWGQRESPDRLDALVHACRFLMEGEKKEARMTSPQDVLSTTLRDLFADSGSYNF